MVKSIYPKGDSTDVRTKSSDMMVATGNTVKVTHLNKA